MMAMLWILPAIVLSLFVGAEVHEWTGVQGLAGFAGMACFVVLTTIIADLAARFDLG